MTVCQYEYIILILSAARNVHEKLFKIDLFYMLIIHDIW